MSDKVLEVDKVDDGSKVAVADKADDDDLDAMIIDRKKKRKAKKSKESSIIPASADESDYTYMEMLSRISRLRDDSLVGNKQKYTLPIPKLSKVGSKKTAWENIDITAKYLNRNVAHIQSYFLAELGTDGSIDGRQQLLIRGRYLVDQIKSILVKYINEYVLCHICKVIDTSLNRHPITRLTFLHCHKCLSRRSVAPIKSGFHSTTKADRKANRDEM